MVKQKSENFLNKQNEKNKTSTCPYNVEVLNSFNHELQLRDPELVIKNKLIHLFTQLKSFKFVAILVLVLKKI